MKAKFTPVLIGLVAAGLYAFNAYKEYAAGDAGAALNWAIGGVCLTIGYACLMAAVSRTQRTKCKKPT
ncbi:MAG: hypothetical protein RKE49_03925 [Oceanicaulis sp.]